MKSYPLAILFGLLLTSCGGAGVPDTQTLAGSYSGTWFNNGLQFTGDVSLTFGIDGHISGTWQDAFDITPFTVDNVTSTFDHLSVRMKMKKEGSIAVYRFEGEVTKVGNHVSGIIYRIGQDARDPYEVSLDLSP
jgi:hypothetical protein